MKKTYRVARGADLSLIAPLLLGEVETEVAGWQPSLKVWAEAEAPDAEALLSLTFGDGISLYSAKAWEIEIPATWTADREIGHYDVAVTAISPAGKTRTLEEFRIDITP